MHRLKSIPGIGAFISMLLVAEIDDLSRFPRAEGKKSRVPASRIYHRDRDVKRER